VVAATLGASFALSRRKRDSRLGAVWFMARVVGLAVLLTVGLAEVVSDFQPSLGVRMLLTPIALLVGFIGDSWPAVLSGTLRRILTAIDLIRGGQRP